MDLCCCVRDRCLCALENGWAIKINGYVRDVYTQCRNSAVVVVVVVGKLCIF